MVRKWLEYMTPYIAFCINDYISIYHIPTTYPLVVGIFINTKIQQTIV